VKTVHAPSASANPFSPSRNCPDAGGIVICKTPTEVLLHDALIALLKACPRNLECNDFSHARRDYHEADEPCKPRHRYEAALEEAESTLNP
jgi:hypothetical protein